MPALTSLRSVGGQLALTGLQMVDLSTLGAGGIPVGFADGAVIEITGAETDLSVSGGLLIGNMPARSSYLVSDQ